MKTIKCKLLIIFLFFIVFMQCNSFAGQSAGIFLELPASARAGGMADCFTALADEPFGAYYNPAGISFIKNPAVSFVYQSYIQDISGNFIGITVPGKILSFNLAPSLMELKDEPVYDSSGDDTGRNFSYRGTVIPFSAAIKIENISFGGTVKYYQEEIGSYSKNVTTFDTGAMYRFRHLSLGISGLNLSGKLGAYELPKTLRYGVAFNYKTLNLLLDYYSQLVIQRSFNNAGGELFVSDFLFIRLGYKFKNDFGDLSYGLGIKMGKYNIDYSASNYNDLGMSHRLGASYCFGNKTRGQ